MTNQAVILAGGRGTRLEELTDVAPKPLLPVGGVPFIEHQIWNLKRQGVTNIIITVSYMADMMIEVLGDGQRLGVNIDYYIEAEPMGTGGAFAHLHEKLEDTFFVLNGDTILDVNFASMASAGQAHNADAVIALRKVDDRSRYGTVELEGDMIAGFREKDPAMKGPGLVSGGIYLLTRDTVADIKNIPFSLETDLFPALVKDKNCTITAFADTGFFLDIGLKETYSAAQTLIPQWRQQIEA